MMNNDEPGVTTSPRPAPISCANVLWIPSLTAFGAWNTSLSCARASPDATPIAASPQVATRNFRNIRLNRMTTAPFHHVTPSTRVEPIAATLLDGAGGL